MREAFNIYLNTCPHQGSRTIRTEVFAVFVSFLVYEKVDLVFLLCSVMTEMRKLVR